MLNYQRVSSIIFAGPSFFCIRGWSLPELSTSPVSAMAFSVSARLAVTKAVIDEVFEKGVSACAVFSTAGYKSVGISTDILATICFFIVFFWVAISTSPDSMLAGPRLWGSRQPGSISSVAWCSAWWRLSCEVLRSFCRYHLVCQNSCLKWPLEWWIFPWIAWWSSVAMLNYQRVAYRY